MRGQTDRQLYDLQQGRVTSVGNVTLDTGTTTTTVTHKGVSDNSCIVLTPSNAAMAAEWATTVPYVSSQGLGSFEITHANAATARTIRSLFLTPVSR